MDIKIKDILKLGFVFVFFSYFIVILLLVISLIFNIDLDTISYFKLTVIDLIGSCIVGVVIMFLYRNLLKNDYKKSLKTFEKPKIINFIKTVFIGFLEFLAIKVLSAYAVEFIYLISGITNTITDNQNAIEILTGSAPAMMMISTVILAPIIEELVFRGAIRKVIKNKKVFIAVSGLVFGLVHVVNSLTLTFEIIFLGFIISLVLGTEKIDKKKKKWLITAALVCTFITFAQIYYCLYGTLIGAITAIDLKEIIGSITYITAGIYLAHLYATKDNIYLNIGVHAFNNLFSMILILFF